MIALLIIILFLFILASLFFLPVSIVADSDGKTYFISIPVYFKLSLSRNAEDWKVRLRIFLIPINLNKVNLQGMSFSKKESRSKRNKKIRKLSVNKMFPIINKAYKSFRIRELKASIDTGDYPLNAQLIPLASHINNENITVGINFEGKNSIHFEAVTRLYKLTWILIRYIYF